MHNEPKVAWQHSRYHMADVTVALVLNTQYVYFAHVCLCALSPQQMLPRIA